MKIQVTKVRVSRKKLKHVWLVADEKNLLQCHLGKSKERVFSQLPTQNASDITWLHQDDPSLNRVLKKSIQQLEQYFLGKRKTFDLPINFDPLKRTTPFSRKVLNTLQKLDFGQTMSYGELAKKSGHVGASRASGSAIGKNPLPIIIPCHRILHQSGGIGGFTGGIEVKKELLNHEGITV